MGDFTAKDLRLAPVESSVANRFIRRHHYSGKVVNNSQLHLGAYLGATLEGVMSFGPPLDRSKLAGLVDGTKRQNLLELNRMAFSERLPRNSESRAIAVSLRLLRRHRPQIKWVVSFADATQCGDGTIYRAAGFVLTAIRPNNNTARFPDGEVRHKMTLESGPLRRRDFLGGRSYFDVTGGRYDWAGFVRSEGATVLPGYQLRYVAFLDRAWRDRLTVPEIPYAELSRRGVSMYRGERPDGVTNEHAPRSSGEAAVQDRPRGSKSDG